MRHPIGAGWALVLLCTVSAAQEPGKKPDPVQAKIKELVTRANGKLREIDSLLLGAAPGSREGRRESARRLDRAKERQQQVIEAIDKLIRSLPRDDRQQGGGSPPPQDQEHKKQGEKEKKKREQEKTPDLKQKEEERKPEKKGDPRDDKEKDRRQGSNEKRPAPPENPTGATPPQGGVENWGNLPAWVKKFFKKGDVPRLPEKYRKLWEEFQKRNREKR